MKSFLLFRDIETPLTFYFGKNQNAITLDDFVLSSRLVIADVADAVFEELFSYVDANKYFIFF